MLTYSVLSFTFWVQHTAGQSKSAGITGTQWITLLPKTPCVHSQNCQPSLNHSAWFRQRERGFFGQPWNTLLQPAIDPGVIPNMVRLTGLGGVPCVPPGLMLAPGFSGAAMSTAVSVWTGTHQVSLPVVQPTQRAQGFRAQCPPRDSQYLLWKWRARTVLR